MAAKKEPAEKYSYSKTDTYDNCPMRFKISYVDKHYVFNDTLATLLGTLIHHIEEKIGRCYIDGEVPDYDALIDELYNINVPKKDKYDKKGGIYGANVLAKMYPNEFYEPFDDDGECYSSLIDKYATTGIYRLGRFLKENPQWVVHAVEQEFSVDYYCPATGKHYTLYGFIDRVLRNVSTNEYMIEDIKTRHKLFSEDDIKSPMQFFFYSCAVKYIERLFDFPTSVRYNLVLMDVVQDAGTKGWIRRCQSKLDKILASIEARDFKPKPSALCYWCPFSGTNPERFSLEEKDRNLCPYFSHWTREHKVVWDVENKWEGVERHDAILLAYREKVGSDSSGIGIEIDDEPTMDELALKFDFDF